MNGKDYVDKIIKDVQSRNKGEEEFIDAVIDVLESLVPLLNADPKYYNNSILERIVEPDRQITFQVPWIDEKNKIHVNRGFRVQFNSYIGPYKGGIRFHPTVNQSIIKFLGFEQIFKNSLSGMPLGGGKGGSDFDPKGKSDEEILRFCQSFMTELYRHIGKDLDVPAGDIGVGKREIGYLYGQYRRIVDMSSPGVMTGKGLDYGGSLGRTEATGSGLVYFINEILKDRGISLKNKKVIVSGSGNVAFYSLKKLQEYGATVIAMSDSVGYIYDEEGIDADVLYKVKMEDGLRIKEYVSLKGRGEYHENARDIWSNKCDIALPCATQREINEKDALKLVQNGVILIGEGANMPSTLKAQKVFIKNKILFAPAKAANAGGVSVSALEMSQNSMRISWSSEEVDNQLKTIMKDIYKNASEMAIKYSNKDDLLTGANIAGFAKVADAMIELGI